MQENRKKYYIGALTINTSSSAKVIITVRWRAGVVLTSEIFISDCEVKYSM